METVEEVLGQCKWLIEHGRAKEQAKLLLPRIASKRRVENKEKKSRVVFSCTPEQFSAFHRQLKRYRELVVNTTIATDILIAFLAQPSDGDIQAVAEEVETGEFAMGRQKDSIGE